MGFPHYLVKNLTRFLLNDKLSATFLFEGETNQ